MYFPNGVISLEEQNGLTVVHSTYPINVAAEQFIAGLEESMRSSTDPIMLGDLQLLQLFMNGSYYFFQMF